MEIITLRDPSRKEIMENIRMDMSLFEDEEVFMERVRYSACMIKAAIVGYRGSSPVRMPLVIIPPEIYFDTRKEGQECGYDKLGIALYPNSERFRYDKGDYLASLLSLNAEQFDTLAFIHAERVDDSECRQEWGSLMLDLMFGNPIKISDEVTIERPENQLTVLVCTRKPYFLLKNPSYHYYLIDLTDGSEETNKLYEDYAKMGGEEELYATDKTNMEDSTMIKENEEKINESSSNVKSIDWEERRFQLVMAIINGKLAGKGVYDVSINNAHINNIIGTANRIIERLKTRVNDEIVR